MIFIIGGEGFVGSGIARACERAGAEFRVITRGNYEEYRSRACDVLINANGNSKKYVSRDTPLVDFDASVRSVRVSLEDFRFGKYVLVSSCDVYPDCSSPSTTLEKQPIDVAAESVYGFHKRLAELCVEHRAVDWLIVRCGGFVGPAMKKNPIFDVLGGGPLWLDPSSELQFISTDDSGDILLKLAEHTPSGSVVNLCGDGVISLNEVIAATGRTVPVKPGSPRVRYDVSVAELKRCVPVPLTRDTVLRFVMEKMEGCK